MSWCVWGGGGEEGVHPGRWRENCTDRVDVEYDCKAASAAAGDDDVGGGGKAVLHEVVEQGVADAAAVVVDASVVDDGGGAGGRCGVGWGLGVAV